VRTSLGGARHALGDWLLAGLKAARSEPPLTMRWTLGNGDSDGVSAKFQASFCGRREQMTDLRFERAYQAAVVAPHLPRGALSNSRQSAKRICPELRKNKMIERFGAPLKAELL